MKTYIKFLVKTYFISLINISLIMLSLVFILNLLSELDFFKNLDVNNYFPLFLSVINSPSLIFEMFPFIFLISAQFFFIKLFNNNEIEIFKYTGLKNSKILFILISLSFITSLLIISIFYNFSSSLKKVYLELKSNYTIDGKYLAVVTKNGLWIKDKVDNKILIINASKIEENYLVDSFISEFDKNFNVIRNIYSEKINVNNKEWVVFNPKIFENNTSISKESIIIKSNFDYKRIQSLFSNLSSLSLMKILELKKNYKLLNYSTTEIDIQIQKIVSYPVYLVLMTIIATILMLNTKQFKSTTLKISIGLFFSVLIYFINNFFNVLGNTEKISVISSVWAPLIILSIINFLMVYRINEK